MLEWRASRPLTGPGGDSGGGMMVRSDKHGGAHRQPRSSDPSCPAPAPAVGPEKTWHEREEGSEEAYCGCGGTCRYTYCINSQSSKRRGSGHAWHTQSLARFTLAKTVVDV